jgi:hypothetical protein
VQSDGSIKYSDGTRVSHDPVTGESKIVHADGSSTRANPNEPRRDGDTYVWGDGVRVRATDPAGKVGQVQGNGSILYSDGMKVSHDVRTGDTKFVHGDGRVEVTTLNTPSRDGSYFRWSDQQRALATDRNGGVGKVGADGVISYPDGSRVSHDVRTGESKIVHADGRVEIVPGNVPHRMDDGGFGWSDGVRAPGTDPSGNAGHVGGDGWIIYSDGSRVSHDPTTGDSKIVYSDGTMSMGNSRTGESKSYAPAQERGLSMPSPGGQAGAGTGSGASRSPSLSNHSNQNSGQQHSNQNSGQQHSNQNSGQQHSNQNSSQQHSNQNSSQQHSNQNSNQNNGGSSTPKSSSSDTKAEKAPVEKAPQEKVDKGRQVLGDSPAGSPGNNGTYMKPLNLTGQPVPGDSRGGSGSGSPTNIRVGVGPGVRPTEQSPGGASQLSLGTRALVINPNPVGLTGRGAVTPIDPSGGRR